ncbi:MAG: DUF2851 family protein [Candidatus Cloacimonadales bacterium]
MNISEKFIYHIWDAQHLQPDLITASGKEIKIIFPGRWNNASGADFKDAVIEIEGELKRGDVEIHLKTYDWIAHKHQEDSNFNSVILHVVLHNKAQDKFTVNQAGELIEILELVNFLDQSINKLLKRYQGKKFEAKAEFCLYFAGISSEITAKLLAGNGMERLHKKIKRFSAELLFSDFDQLSYQGIFEALGYDKNKFQMLQLARTISYNQIKLWRRQGMQKEEFMALMICSSSLREHIPANIPREIAQKWLTIYSQQQYFTESLEIDWNLFRLRPVNHPVIRILQVSELIWQAGSNSLFNKLISLFSFGSAQVDIKEFYRRLYKIFRIENDLLPDRYVLGKTRIDTITINIIIPLALLYAQKLGYQNLESVIEKIYREYHKLPRNYIEKHMHKFMQESQKRSLSAKAIHQQGILNLYFEYCKDYNCQLCSEHRQQQISRM